MLKIIDRGFHGSALLLHLLVSCEWAKQFSYLKYELKTTYAQLYTDSVLLVFYFSIRFWFIKLLDFLLFFFDKNIFIVLLNTIFFPLLQICRYYMNDDT